MPHELDRITDKLIQSIFKTSTFNLGITSGAVNLPNDSCLHSPTMLINLNES